MSNRRYGKILLGMFLIGFMMCFMYRDASAFGNLLKSDEVEVFAGTTVNLRDFVDDAIPCRIIMVMITTKIRMNSYFHMSLI